MFIIYYHLPVVTLLIYFFQIAGSELTCLSPRFAHAAYNLAYR